MTEGDKGCDDRARACPVHKIEPLMETATDQALYLLEHSKRVKSLCPSAIEAEHPKSLLLFLSGVSCGVRSFRLCRHFEAARFRQFLIRIFARCKRTVPMES